MLKQILNMDRLLNKNFLALSLVLFLAPIFVFTVTAQDLPPGEPVTLTRLEQLIDTIARFLIRVSMVIAVITFIWAGILWTTAGDSERKNTAKAWLRNGVIGSLVILGVGVILQTGFALVTGDFFSGGGGSTPNQQAGRELGQTCKFSSDPSQDCKQGLICKSNTCVRQTGNNEGEICNNSSDCASGLICEKKPGVSLTKICKKPAGASGTQVKVVSEGFPCNGTTIVCQLGYFCKKNPLYPKTQIFPQTCQK